jgi:sugar lactone lactonase YvrE
MSKNVLRLLLALLGGAILVGALRLLFGGGERLEDRTGAPELPERALEEVASLDYPPGNIAVAADGRIFFTFHPDGDPPVKVAELVNGKPVPYPNAELQQPREGGPSFQTPLALRIDRQGRLWVLDHAGLGRGQPRLFAFDLATGALVRQHDFPSEIAGTLSMLNDFQVSPAGDRIYIAETSPVVQTPALIVYDTATQKSRRVLEGHPSVEARPFLLQAPGRDMRIYGLIALRIAVDSIALDRRGEWLYFGPLSGDRLYRIRTSDLADETISPQALGARVEDYGAKTISDGITTDEKDNVYLSDPEHSAVLVLGPGPEHRLWTLIKDERLRAGPTASASVPTAGST